jgi:hypothetical protein
MRKIFVVTAVAVLAGCARDRVREAPKVRLSATPQALMAAYNENAGRIDSLSAQVMLTFYYPGPKRTRQYRAAAWLDVEKPGKLRLKHDALGPELFNVVSDGTRFWVGMSREVAGEEDTVYTGLLSEVDREWYLRPDRLLAAFSLAELPPPDAPEVAYETWPDNYVLLFLDGSQPRRVAAKATFGRSDLMLNRYQAFDGNAEPALDIQYRAYKDVGGVNVPSLLYIVWPQDDFSVLAEVKDVKLAVTIPPRVWEYRWKEDAKVIELGRPGSFEEIAPTGDAPK